MRAIHVIHVSVRVAPVGGALSHGFDANWAYYSSSYLHIYIHIMHTHMNARTHAHTHRHAHTHNDSWMRVILTEYCHTKQSHTRNDSRMCVSLENGESFSNMRQESFHMPAELLREEFSRHDSKRGGLSRWPSFITISTTALVSHKHCTYILYTMSTSTNLCNQCWQDFYLPSFCLPNSSNFMFARLIDWSINWLL